jgi:hypothetical protein
VPSAFDVGGRRIHQFQPLRAPPPGGMTSLLPLIGRQAGTVSRPSDPHSASVGKALSRTPVVSLPGEILQETWVRRNRVGTWDTGAFDNDTAADWCGDLDEAGPTQRVRMIRDALTAVVDEDGYLDSDLAAEAITAAAIVASQLPGGPPIDSPYAPDFLATGTTLSLPDDLPRLALLVLDRIVGDDSEWRGVWKDSGSFAEAVAELQPIRAALAGSPAQ